jgi:hypothetical protein
MGLYDFSMPYEENNGDSNGAEGTSGGEVGNANNQGFATYGSSPFGSHEYH